MPHPCQDLAIAEAQAYQERRLERGRQKTEQNDTEEEGQ